MGAELTAGLLYDATSVNSVASFQEAGITVRVPYG